jgi:hypothetical protein
MSNLINQGAIQEYFVDQVPPPTTVDKKVLTVSMDWKKNTIKLIFNVCNVVGCNNLPTLRCSSCGLVPYCSENHEELDKPVHHDWCSTLPPYASSQVRQ